MTTDKVRKILKLLVETDHSQEAIGKRFGVTRSCINAIHNLETWKEVTIQWCEDYKWSMGYYPYLVNKL